MLCTTAINTCNIIDSYHPHYNTIQIQYNTKFVKRHVAVASEACAVLCTVSHTHALYAELYNPSIEICPSVIVCLGNVQTGGRCGYNGIIIIAVGDAHIETHVGKL